MDFDTSKKTFFDKAKKDVLDKLYLPDKSKKGNVDKPLVSFIDLINKHNNYYTTSSCSGRICVFTDHDAKIKKDTEWLFVSHEQVKFDELFLSLNNLPESMTSFKLEGLILHVACRTYEDAVKFMIFCQNHGYKHTGILATTKRFIVQVMGVNRFDAPIAINGALMVSKDYLKFVLDEANKKLEKTHNSINQLSSHFKDLFS